MNMIGLTDTMMDLTWKEIEEYAKRKDVILFPLGVIEEHGPHIPTSADIAWSLAMCKRVKEELKLQGRESLIAPPYYFGVNHCTSAFPGTFSLKPDTMTQVLIETFENLFSFGFREVYCFNYHGDAYHINAILKAIQLVNAEKGMAIRLVFDEMEVKLYQYTGEEDFLLVVDPSYPMYIFEPLPEGEEGKLDIHGGAFETGMLHTMYPGLVDVMLAKDLPSTSMTMDEMNSWLAGGDKMRKMLPEGYAGNPSGYSMVSKHAEEIIELQVKRIVEKILDLQ